MDQSRGIKTHVLIFPFPAQGHVNSMLKLAEVLCHLAGINITFLVSCRIRDRLLRHTNVVSRFTKYPGFLLESLPEEIDDGDNINLSAEHAKKFFSSLQSVAKPLLRKFFTTDPSRNTDTRPPVTTVIADGILSVAFDVAQEFGVPLFFFHTVSASAVWAYFCTPQLLEAGELPLTGNSMDKPIANVKGMEGFLRGRDLPSFCRAKDPTIVNIILSETLQTPRAKGLILNTFEDLEGNALSHFRTHCPNIYTIGPLHAQMKTRLAAESNNSFIKPQTNSNSLWEEDRSCIDWLNEQPHRSVLYVSFGSIALISRWKLLEMWHGIVNSGVRFLWGIRPDSIKSGKDGENKPIPEELEKATRARGFMGGWVPQEDVLAHPGVGGFLTHSGWNSTLESLIQGVPMICWPYFADQQTNSRLVGEAWKIGLDMKDTCDRVIVEKMIRELMQVRKDEFSSRADEMAKLARKSIVERGSSYCNLDRLIQDILKG